MTSTNGVQRCYLGSYPHAGGEGIGIGWSDPATGQLTIDSWTTQVAEPSWLDLPPTAGLSEDRDPRRSATLYAISELTPGGLISALRIRDDGSLALLDTLPTGVKPAHVTVHPDGRFLITSMYGDGTIAVHPILDDGSVAPVVDVQRLSAREQAGNAHQVVFDPTGSFVLAVDLGTDTVVSFRMDAGTGRLNEVARAALRTGSGPRHLVFHPNGRYAYVVNELDSTTTVCAWDRGILTPGQIVDTRSVEPAGTENYPGEIEISADGRFVYVSNRGDDSIAVFAIIDDGAELKLLATPGCGGVWPRHLTLDPTGRWLYVSNERSGNVSWFPVDPGTGHLGPEAGSLLTQAPVHLRFA